MKKKRIAFILLAAFLVLLPLRAPADGGDAIYTVKTENGDTLFTFAGDVDKGDEYISADNQRYTIVSVNDGAKTAVARHDGAQEMPDVNWLSPASAITVSSAGGSATAAPSDSANSGKKLIAMYCTHSDESYKPTDGTQSAENGKGGIYDVANALKSALEDNGVEVILDETKHVPHDAGAYRRSRETAIELLKNAPDAIIDIHRDGIPDPDEYKTTVDGEQVSKVRLLVGRSNQNASANKEFALQLKAVADKQYPDLIKDIYIGKGSYNQDLMSNAILLEFGTHTLDKERTIASAKLMSNVITDTLYGGDVNGAAGGGSNQQKASQGAGTGTIWLIIGVVAVIGVFAFLMTGSGKVAWEKVKRNTSEMTLGLFGKKPEKKE